MNYFNAIQNVTIVHESQPPQNGACEAENSSANIKISLLDVEKKLREIAQDLLALCDDLKLQRDETPEDKPTQYGMRHPNPFPLHIPKPFRAGPDCDISKLVEHFDDHPLSCYIQNSQTEMIMPLKDARKFSKKRCRLEIDGESYKAPLKKRRYYTQTNSKVGFRLCQHP